METRKQLYELIEQLGEGYFPVKNLDIYIQGTDKYRVDCGEQGSFNIWKEYEITDEGEEVILYVYFSLHDVFDGYNAIEIEEAIKLAKK